MTRVLLCFLSIIWSFQLLAQDEPEGDFSTVAPVKISDFAPVSPLVNKETDAVVLVDSGATTLDARLEDGFFIKYYQFNRILILKQSALDDLDKVEIVFSKHMNGKTLKNLRVFSYNLVGGQIFRTEMEDKEIYLDRINSNYRTIKFSFANIKPGSIIEYDFSQRAATAELQDWYFQGNYPKLKSIYTVTLPDMFNFSITMQNKKYITSTTKSSILKTVYSSHFEYLDSKMTTISWTCENVPALRKESYVSCMDNYLASIKFQMSVEPVRPGLSQSTLQTWQQVAGTIMSRSDFSDPSSFLKKQAKLFCEGKQSILEKAHAIYDGVQSHFKADGRGVVNDSDKDLDDVYKSGVGNVGAINTILYVMLKSQQIPVDPVILGTRDKGLTNQSYPLLDKMNYLLCRTEINGIVYYLDASDKTLGFGKVPLQCYNGHARVLQSMKNFPVFLAPDSVIETRKIIMNIKNSRLPQEMLLQTSDNVGYYESSDIRKEVKDKKIKDIFIKDTKTMQFGKTLDSFSIAGLENLDSPISLNSRMTLSIGNDAHLYINPFLNQGLQENPFKSAERLYPIEMPYVSKIQYEVTMEIPVGYEIEEFPKSVKYLLNETDGFYEYKSEVSNNKIRTIGTMNINKAIFEPEDYRNLQDFYTQVIKKENEMIVLKKKS